MKNIIKTLFAAASFFCTCAIAQTTWTGTTSSDWSDASNWSSGVPVATNDVIIAPPLNGNFTVISAPAFCNNITILPGAYLGFNSATTLEVHGNMDNQSTFEAGTGTVLFAGNTHVTGVFVFNHIAITGTLIASSTGMQLKGNWVNNGVFLHNQGTIDFFGSTTISGSATSSFYNVGIYGSLTGCSGSFSVQGNWMNNGTFHHNNGTVRFNGTTNQSIGLSSETVFCQLIVDNPTLGVCLVSNVKINSQLILLNGYFSLYTFKVTINNPSPNGIIRSNGYILSETTPAAGYSFVNWNLGSIKNKYIIPFGTADYYIPVEVEVISTAIGTGILGVATYHTDDPNNPYPNTVTCMNDSNGNDFSDEVVDRFWITSATGFSVSPVSAITFKAATEEIGTNDHLAINKWIGTNWVTASTTQQSLPGGARAENLTDYAVFILANGKAPEDSVTDPGNEPNPNNIVFVDKQNISINPNIVSSSSVKLNASGFTGNDLNVSVCDASGKIVYNGNQVLSSGSASINMDHVLFNSGMYFITLTSDQEKIVQRLAVVN